ncbi:hypothetical protein Tco_0666999 [Tanacetum coccineum]
MLGFRPLPHVMMRLSLAFEEHLEDDSLNLFKFSDLFLLWDIFYNSIFPSTGFVDSFTGSRFASGDSQFLLGLGFGELITFFGAVVKPTLGELSTYGYPVQGSVML